MRNKKANLGSRTRPMIQVKDLSEPTMVKRFASWHDGHTTQPPAQQPRWRQENQGHAPPAHATAR